MAGISCVVCLLVGSFLRILTPANGDTEAYCVLTESCILPCSFQPGSDAVIHWIQVTGNTPVHSYYHDQDQLARQDQCFSGRTSLFKDQISTGNASLRLTGVEVQDRGRYKCFTSTISANKESFINLNVETLVRKVDIRQVENRITCSSEGIYPEPELTWSTSPPSSLTPQDKPTVQQTEQQLYSISSALILSDSVTDLVYSCTVSTGRNRRTATLRQLPSVSVSSTDATIPCSVSNTSLVGFSLVWTFNHTQIILNQTGANVSQVVSEEWRKHVKGVSESSSLTLHSLSSKQEGVYTCELSKAEETHVTNIPLRLEKESHTGVVVAVVVGVILVVLLIVFVLYCKYKRKIFNGETM